MTSPHVSLERTGHVATLTLVSNSASSVDFRASIIDAVGKLTGQPARVVILKGRMDAFTTSEDAHENSGPARAVASLTKPTIAFIDGDCLDAGLELALACDVRYASATSRFAIRQVHQGTLPSDGGTQRLARAIGRAHALRILLSGEAIDANEALRIGLIQRIGTLDDAIAWAERVAEGAPIATAYAKEAATASFDLTLGQGLRLEADLSVLLQSTDDRSEGLDAFRRKRKPKYEGR